MINNRQQQGRRRGRGRGPQGNSGGRNENGSRIDNRARGNAPQMLEKYKNLARDAQMQGDRVMTEYYLQFADHYFRIVAEGRARFEEQRRQRDDWNGEDEEGEERSSSDMGDDDVDVEPYEMVRPRQNSRPQRDQNSQRDQNQPREQGAQREPREPRAPRQQNAREDRGNSRYANGNVSQHHDDEAAPATLDISVLPPAFASDGPMVQIDLDDEPAPMPKRRGRPKRAAEAVEEAAE